MATPQQIANYVPGITLAAPLTNAAGPIVATLSSVAGLPTVGVFRLRLDDPAPATTYEIVEVTSVNVGASQVTIGTRGLEGTSAIAHATGTIVGNQLTAAMLLAAFPWGALGYTQVIVNQNGITTQVDLTNLTVTVTVGSARRLRISAHVYFASSVALDCAKLQIWEGATQFNEANIDLRLANFAYKAIVDAIITPTAGAHTYKLGAVRSNGTGNINTVCGATQPGFILAEDIGAA